jgi:hypothetical protein
MLLWLLPLMLLLVLLLLLLKAISRGDVNDGVIDRPRLFAKDPTLFSLFQNIFTPSVERFRYTSICLNCVSKWAASAAVPLVEGASSVSATRSFLFKRTWCKGRAAQS